MGIDLNACVAADLWEDVRRRGEERYYRPDHDGRPERLRPEDCRWFDHARSVRSQFTEIESTSGGVRCPDYGPFDGSVAIKILVRRGTTAARKKEIVAAYRAFKMPKGCSWSSRDDGPIWIFADKSAFVAAD
jgi:hypothetical protein